MNGWLLSSSFDPRQAGPGPAFVRRGAPVGERRNVAAGAGKGLRATGRSKYKRHECGWGVSVSGGLQGRQGTKKINGLKMIRINARGDESVGQMIKRFQRMCQKEGLTRDIRRNSYYEKPSERRRRRLRKSLRRSLSAGR